MKRNLWAGLGFAVLLFGVSPALAQSSLGTAQSFAVLGGSAVTNTGATTVSGDLGVSPGNAVTGFPPGTVTGGIIRVNDAVAIQAQNDVTTAYNAFAGMACNTVLTGTDLGGLTLTPGVYCFATSAQLTGTLTLDAQGNPNAVFVFQIGSTLITASNARVQVINGGQACNVFWQVGSSATLGTDTAFVGSILALTSITLNTRASILGRALARNGAVTLDTNVITRTGCAPSLGVSFSPATINAGGVSTKTITLSNPNSTPAALTAPLTDNLPAGLVIAAAPNASTTCGGVVTAPAGGSTITLTGGAIPGGVPGTCTVTVNVTAAVGGNYLNALPANALQTSNGNSNAGASATLTVIPPGPAPPLLGKAFTPATIPAGGVSTLTITLSNPNPGAVATLTAPLTDTLPAGVLIAGTPNASTTCGGVVTATAGGNTVTLTGGAIPAGAPGTCTVTVNVTVPLPGNYLNTLSANALQTSNGNNDGPASATLTVVQPPPAPPLLGKAFGPATIPAGGVSTLTITLSNSNANAATLTAPLTDNLPAGLVIAPAPNASTTCGGVVTATAGGSTVTLTGGTIPGGGPGTCTVTVNVTAAVGGNYFNALPANALQTSNGNNAAPALATLTVIPPGPAPPLLGKAFNPATIPAGGVSTLTITLLNSNPGAAAILTAPLTDTLPPGLVIAPTPNASTTCGGVVTATAGGNTVTLTGGAIPAGAPGACTVTVNVTAAVGGNYLNALPANALQTSNGNNAAPALATLTVSNVIIVLPSQPTSMVSAQKAGSVLIYNFYTSSATASDSQNTRINLTNTDARQRVAVHLFFVDGSTCSVADAFICLTPNQTTSFLTSDVDPGVTGYLVAVAVDLVTGCPLTFNFLIGDEYVKLASGHAANLGAEALASLLGVPTLCDGSSSTAELKFDGVSYDLLPRVLALDNLASPADGNNTLLIVNRIGGSLATGAAPLGALFGLLYNDAENAFSFTFTAGGCQFRGSLTDSFPRITPRLTTVIPAGRSGWLKLWGANNIGLLGAALNFNPNAGTNAGAFNQGHNLHKLTLTSAASVTIPVFPPSC